MLSFSFKQVETAGHLEISIAVASTYLELKLTISISPVLAGAL
jgi:hypothetical protein